MSTTRSQKRNNAQRDADDNVSEGFILPINMESSRPLDQDIELAGPSKPKSPRVENSLLESLRSSLKEEITSEVKTLLLESQKEMLKLLRPETRENIRVQTSGKPENETRSFYTPTKTVRINSTQNEDPGVSHNKGKAPTNNTRCRILFRREIYVRSETPLDSDAQVIVIGSEKRFRRLTKKKVIF